MSNHLHAASQYALNLPYPEVKVEKKNSYYAALLQDDYAGRVSEFTAISQYLYHHFWFMKNYPELAELLEGISIVEMHHMEMLAETIILLGGDPKIGGTYSTACRYWNGALVYYGYNVSDRLQADINAEIEAINTYNYHVSLIHDRYIRQLLKRIVMDEEEHLKLFKNALKNI